MARIRMQEAREREVIQAWDTAALTAAAMVGKLPKLKRLLADIRPQAKPAGRLTLADISRTVGVPMRPASPEAVAALQRLGERLA